MFCSNMIPVHSFLNNVPGPNRLSMDALPPDPAASEMRPKQAPNAATSNRTVDYFTAVIMAGLAFAISPFAIRLLTGRSELGFRAFLLSVTFDLFLLLVAGAVLARGRWR